MLLEEIVLLIAVVIMILFGIFMPLPGERK